MNPKNNNPKVAIITLNWNTWEDTIEALESIYQSTYSNYEIVVVDNASMDGSIEKIKEYADGQIEVKSPYVKYDPSNKPIYVVEYTKEDAERGGLPEYESKLKNIPSNKKLIIIKNDENYGYAEGNNIGIRYILNKDPKKEFKYILLLNNDVAVDKSWLNELVKVMEKDPKVGIAGSKVLDYYNPNLIQNAGGYIYWWVGWIKDVGWIPDNGDSRVEERDFVWSTSALFRRELFETLGFLDPYFFFGVEEYDFNTRAKKAGFKILYVPTSKIWHKKGASAKKLDLYKEVKQAIIKQRGFLYYKHYYRLFKKHLPPIIFLIPFLLFMQRNLSKLGFYFLKHLAKGEFDRIVAGIRRLKEI
ncbi:MAG: glycosyltransferase family 2 protein [Archaeoglobus sp.]|uniref:glycosyltransferase family 2 protein n=1 Tax=Archaeoglobus sp. TaxID=1872626 RepID=UPI001E08835B|nr:glycosyltransferase family 2 protein [Archaeoglobus sp.]MBO8180933.1 glycosyltransferase family 2 protein [Archaeoglobus sp.]